MKTSLKEVVLDYKRLKEKEKACEKDFERLAVDCNYRTTIPRPIMGTERACSWHRENYPRIRALFSCDVGFCPLQHEDTKS